MPLGIYREEFNFPLVRKAYTLCGVILSELGWDTWRRPDMWHWDQKSQHAAHKVWQQYVHHPVWWVINDAGNGVGTGIYRGATWLEPTWQATHLEGVLPPPGGDNLTWQTHDHMAAIVLVNSINFVA